MADRRPVRHRRSRGASDPPGLAPRHAALRLEIDLLDRSIQNTFQFAEDAALARIPDAQGMGGVSTAAVVDLKPGDGVADAA